MRSTFGHGVSNGIQYEIKVDEYYGQKGLILLEVPKHLLQYSEQMMETEKISFLGYTWTACVTTASDDTLEAYFCLHSCNTSSPPRCSWWINDPSTFASKHSLIEQGKLYGGKIQKHRLQPGRNGSAILTFHIELQDQPRDDFSIHIDGSVAYCKWAVRPTLEAENGEYWTKTFEFGQGDWGLWMVEHQGACQTFFLNFPPELDSIFVDCRVILFNHAFPEKSVAARKQGRGWRLKIPTVDFRLCFSDEPEGFLRDGWLQFGLRIAVSDTPSGYFTELMAFEQAMVSIEVITDRRICDHVENRGLSRVFRIPRSKTYILSVHAPLETVQEKIERDAGLQGMSSVTWLYPARTNGVFSRVVCLCDLEELKPCLGELANHDADPEDHPTLTFFIREHMGGTLLLQWPRQSILLFAMLLDPIEQNVEYLGSVFTQRNTKLHVLCFTDLCGLDSKLENNIECSFFVWGEAEQLLPIRAYQQTVEKCGLITGSIVIIRPTDDGETVTSSSMALELQSVPGDHPFRRHVSETASSTPTNQTFVQLEPSIVDEQDSGTLSSNPEDNSA